MKSLLPRVLASLALVVVACLAGASAPHRDLQPDKLVILSTTDVKGKTSPCG